MQVSSGRPHMLTSNQRGRGTEPVTVLGRIRSAVAVNMGSSNRHCTSSSVRLGVKATQPVGFTSITSRITRYTRRSATPRASGFDQVSFEDSNPLFQAALLNARQSTALI